MNSYYVYAHIDPKTKEPFYIGKGTRSRSQKEEGRNEYWHTKVKELDGKYKTEIIKEGLSEKEALELERKLIIKYGKEIDGRGSLVNIDGGVGGISHSLSTEISMDDVNDVDLTDTIDKEQLKELEKNIELINKHYAENPPEEIRDIESGTKEKLGKEFLNSFNQISDKFYELMDEGDGDLEMTVDTVIYELSTFIQYFQFDNAPTQEFVETLEDNIDYLEDDIDEYGTNEPEFIQVGKEVIEWCKKTIKKVKTVDNNK